MANQEKMQKIYELTGIEPRYVESCDPKDPSCGNLYIYRKFLAAFEEEALRQIEWSAHYPAEQLWEMLPEIKDYCLRMNKSIIYYEHWADSRHEVPDLIEFSIINGDLLAALLDMVLWAIENGHIKKRGEGCEIQSNT